MCWPRPLRSRSQRAASTAKAPIIPVITSIQATPTFMGAFGLARDGHDPGVALEGGVVAGLLGPGPGVAEARDGEVNEAGVQGL